jgi:hypothetical protein
VVNEFTWLRLWTGKRLVGKLIKFPAFLFFLILQRLLKKSSAPRCLLQPQSGYSLWFPRETTLLPGFGALLVYQRLRFTPLVRVGFGGGIGGRIAASRAVVVPRVPQGPVVRRLGPAAPTDTSVPFVSTPPTYRHKVTTHKQPHSHAIPHAYIITRGMHTSNPTFLTSCI